MSGGFDESDWNWNIDNVPMDYDVSNFFEQNVYHQEGGTNYQPSNFNTGSSFELHEPLNFRTVADTTLNDPSAGYRTAPMPVAEAADEAHLAGGRGRGGRGHGRGHVPVVEGPYPQHLAGGRGRGGRGRGRGHVPVVEGPDQQPGGRGRGGRGQYPVPVVEGPDQQPPEADLAGGRGRGGRSRPRRRYAITPPTIEPPVYDFFRTQVASLKDQLETMVDIKVETKVKAVVDPRFDALEHLIRSVAHN